MSAVSRPLTVAVVSLAALTMMPAVVLCLIAVFGGTVSAGQAQGATILAALGLPPLLLVAGKWLQ